MTPLGWPPALTTRCSVSPPNSPLGTGSMVSNGNLAHSRFSSSSSSSCTSPCNYCEPCSARRLRSSICYCIASMVCSFSATLSFCCSSTSLRACSRVADSPSCMRVTFRCCRPIEGDEDIDITITTRIVACSGTEQSKLSHPIAHGQDGFALDEQFKGT